MRGSANPRYNRRLTWGLGLAALLLAGALAASLSPSTPGTAAASGSGQTLFRQDCAGCHAIGGGRLVGPDLKGVTNRRSATWLVRWISAPDKLIAAGDPTATALLKDYNGVAMPNMGLSQADASSIVDYLASTGGTPAGGTPAPATTTTPAANLTGDATRGRQLFLGAVGLQNGGPACASCHVTNDTNGLGAKSLGPDLTHAYTNYGGATGMQSVLAALPFPTMQGPFQGKPLTPQERADLVAYFQQVDTETPQPAPDYTIMIWLALGGALVLLGLSQMIWRKRFTGVRKALVGGTK